MSYGMAKAQTTKAGERTQELMKTTIKDNRIVIVVEGGVVQSVLTSDPTVQVILVDHDNLEDLPHSQTDDLQDAVATGLHDTAINAIEHLI